MSKQFIEQFEEAFTSHGGGACRTCECGKTYYCLDYGDAFEEGEVEELEADPKATEINYDIRTIYLDGGEYCIDCDCWHERAKKVMQWMHAHRHSIVSWFKLEKERLQVKADDYPVVEKPEL